MRTKAAIKKAIKTAKPAPVVGRPTMEVRKAKETLTRGESVPRLPATPAACGDLLYEVREKRIALEQEVKAMEKQEAMLKDRIALLLPKSDATGVRGKVAQVSVETKEKPTVKDWEAVQKYVHKHHAYDLFQRRLNDAAVAARWDNKEEIPGVDHFKAVIVHCTKLGSKK